MNVLYELPTQWWGDARTHKESELVAVESLMNVLGACRQTQYELNDRPDQVHRNQRSADFRYRSVDNGEIVAIEYKRFVDPDDQEAAAHLKRGKQFRPKGSVTPMEHPIAGQWGAMLSGVDAGDLITRLREFILTSIRRRQLQSVDADERMLFIEDGLHIPVGRILKGDFSFSMDERDSVDHACFLSPGSSGATPEPTVVLKIW